MKLDSAQHVGRAHLSTSKNLQDAIAIRQTLDFATGWVMDGCSEGKHSEAGAALAAEYMAHTVQQYHLTFPWMKPSEIVLRLQQELDYFLRKMLQPYAFGSDEQKEKFVIDYLLFTVVGFIWTPEEVTFCWQGDGTIGIDDTVFHLNVGNTPAYAAYRVIPWAVPDDFEVPPLTHETRTDCKKFFIGSDAWKDEQALIPTIWTASHLQREINKLSRIQHKFADDVSVIRGVDE